jgi:hypothetical protein
MGFKRKPNASLPVAQLLQPADGFKATASQAEQAEAVAAEARAFIKAHHGNLPSLLLAIQATGTPVIVVTGLQAGAVQLGLMSMGLSVGYISPDGDSERYEKLVKLIQGHCGEQLPDDPDWDDGVFVLVPGLLNIHYVAHQLHHWLSCKAGLDGYYWDQQKAFREFQTRYKGTFTQAVDKRGPDFLRALQHPLRREIDTIAFVKSVTEEILSPAFEGQRQKQTGTAYG